MEDMLTTEYDGCGRCLVGVRRLSRKTDKTSSPERQGNQILAACNDAGGHIIAWADDWEVSGATDPLTRPGFGPWLRGEMGPYDGIVSASVDRVGRNVRDTLNTQAAECGFTSTGVPNGIFEINPSRLLSCSDFFYTVLAFEETDGVFSIVGDFFFEDQSWATFSETSLTWVHDMQTITYGGDGVLTDGVNGFMSSNCTVNPTACTATSTGAPDPQIVFLAPDSTYSWEWDEQDAGPASTTAGTEDTLDTVLGVNWDLNLPGTNDVENETGGLDGRCDNGDTGDGTAGCVDEKFIPTLYLSYALYGASVDMVNFAANNIPPYYGNEFSPTPTPLHRLASTTQQTANRKVICGTAVFTPDSTITAALAPYGDKDSCDEYPFAATYESGAMQTGFDGQPKPFVTTGADCWQGTAVQSGSDGVEPADWNVMLLDSTSTTQCIRAHIPQNLNTALGGAYGRFIQKQRLLDKDAFWVFATP
jgi:hypothetical protein